MHVSGHQLNIMVESETEINALKALKLANDYLEENFGPSANKNWAMRGVDRRRRYLEDSPWILSFHYKPRITNHDRVPPSPMNGTGTEREEKHNAP
jgi:hypothetical protein